MPGFVRAHLFFAAASMLSGWAAGAVGQAPVNRIVVPIDEAQVVTLQGNVHPLARAEFDQGEVAADTRLGQMVLVLEPSATQQAELDALVEAQHGAGSPLFHHWLTPAEYGARFGLSAQDLAHIAAWLKGHGFTVDEIPAGNRLVIFSGTAGEVAEAFHTGIHRYRVDGAQHLANAENPQIPAALGSVVGGVVSLHDFRSRSQIAARRTLGVRPQYSSGSTHYLFPADFAMIYDLDSLYGAGTAGAGTSIAIVGRSNLNLSDVAAFRAEAGLAANTPAVTLVGANPGLVPGDQDEATLDVEWSGAIAPAATVKFVVEHSTATTDGVDLSAQYVVNHAMAPVVSSSYGSCEQEMGSAELAFYNGLWEQAASQGMSVFVASGDAGAAGCYAGSASIASGAAVNGMCSSPYSTCVGGTEFNEGSNPSQYWLATNSMSYESALSYIPEQVWNQSGSNGGSGLWASGGGASVVYAQPTWQKGVIGTSEANGMRAVPDVAMTAAAHDGYVIAENGTYFVISGTSAASPSFAGIMALLVETQGGAGQGNANAGLYPLLNAQRNPFHATPSGNNSVPGVTGFAASGAAYNLATGLGSVDGALLVSQWGSGSVAGADFTITASSAAGTVQVGKTAAFTIKVAESGAGTNAVALTAKAPAGVTVDFSSASILPGTWATVTVAVGATAVAGTQNITVTGSDAAGTQSLTYALTVTPLPTVPDFTITVASGMSSAATVMPGGTAEDTFTISPANGAGAFPNAIALSASGLPAAATAVFSPATVPAGSGTTTVTLTIQLPRTPASVQPIGGIGTGIIGRLAPLSLALLLLPFAGRPRRHAKRLVQLGRLVLLSIAGVAAMAGLSNCSSLSGFPGQSPQTYTVTVTGTSGALSHSTTVILTVE
jgi:subtilase family serine protease